MKRSLLVRLCFRIFCFCFCSAVAAAAAVPLLLLLFASAAAASAASAAAAAAAATTALFLVLLGVLFFSFQHSCENAVQNSPVGTNTNNRRNICTW